MSYQLTDSFGRTINNLRVSVTDQCNFRCIYCMPEVGMIFQPREEILTFEEIYRFVEIATGLGISKLRLTGGEPTVRKDLPLLVRMLSKIPGVQDMAMTTNGFLLRKMARELHEAGLPRINVSLDTLDEEKFIQMTRRDVLHKVLDGLEEATRYFQLPIKINVVAMKGYTEDELLDFAKMARTGPFQVRFIEFMPLDADRSWTRDQVLDGAEIIERINDKWPLDAVKRPKPERTSRLVSLSGRQGRDRSHRLGQRTLLRQLQPHSHHGGRQDAHLPVLDQRDRYKSDVARRRDGRGNCHDHHRCRQSQGTGASHQRTGLRPA